MHGLAFLQDLAVVMIVAGMVTILFHQLKQPVVLGYIIAGFIIGPHTPGHFIHEETIHALAEMGIVFLMFALGMEFNLRKLKAVGAPALVAASLQIAFMFGLGHQIGRAFGWSSMNSLFLGAMISISSTTIIVKALRELNLSKEPFANLIFGMLIIEDIVAVVMLALLSGIAMTGSASVAEIGVTIGKISIFLAAALVFGLIGIPRLLAFVARFKSDEMLLVAVLGLVFGFSLLAVKLGYSSALGAFVIGALVAETRELGRIEHLTKPVHDMFSAIFFVAIGMLIDPKILAEYWLPIAVITAAVIVGKLFSCTLGALVAGKDLRTSVHVGTGMSQIGEFSFIIASLGLSLKVTSEFLYPVAVAVSVLTTLATPYLIRGTGGLTSAIERYSPKTLIGFLEVYSRWLGGLGGRTAPGPAARMIRRWSLQMGLNILLIGGIFLAAAFVGKRRFSWLPQFLSNDEIYRIVVWLTAVVLSMPMFIATFRKLQALGMLVSELKVTRAAAGERTAALRAIVANAITYAGLAGMVIYGLSLSTALLSPSRFIVLVLVVVPILTILLWRSSIRIYSKGQVALQETLSQPTEHHEPSPAAVKTLLKEADLETVAVAEASPAARKLIRELALRTRSGASIVGIERGGTAIINPGPDEELLAGDTVLLIGSPGQLRSAREVFGEPVAAPA